MLDITPVADFAMESATSIDNTMLHPFPQAKENADRCEALSKEIATLAAHLNAGNHRFLKLIAEFDSRKGWNAEGCQSCAHWLNWKCGIAIGAAREKVRTAHALENLPKISASMERGELSYSKVRELTRVADAATEDTLLMYAQHGTAMHVERIVRGFRRCKDAEELGRESAQQMGRFFSYRYDNDGSLVFHGQIPAEAAALFLKALGAAVDAVPKEDVPAGTPTITFTGPSIGQRRADALALIAEVSSHTATNVSPAAIVTKSSSTLTPRLWSRASPVAASSKMAPQWPPKQCAASAVMRASLESPRMRRARR